MRLLARAFWLVAALFLFAGVSAAADRSTTLLPDTDLPGFDYSTLKSTTLKACASACEGDNLCRAFTFNESAKWCFLKGEVGQSAPFDGATSGTVPLNPAEEVTEGARLGELPFPASDIVSGAKYFAQGLAATDPAPKGLTYVDLVASGDEAVGQGNAAAAIVSYRQALGLNNNDPKLWLKLANLIIERADIERQAGNGTYELGVNASYSAALAFIQSTDTTDRAEALRALGRALEVREMWRETIATYRTSLALVDNLDLQKRLDDVVAQHGFRITSNEVDSEAADPRICVVFSDPLPPGQKDLSSYVAVDDAPQVAVETEESQICLTGVEHGKRYHLKFRSGLPSADGESLRADVELNVFVPDRSPFVGFANNAYVMPAGLGGGLPITSINADTADVVIYRIGDRSIATAVRNGVFQRTLDGYSAEDVANSYGEKSWEGQVDLARGAANEMTTTAIPVAQVVNDLEPGAYVITAKVNNSKQEFWQEMATQWFIVTDLGLTTVSGDDGVHAFIRSLTSAQAVAGVKVRLVAVNNEILGEGVTDADGRADFAPGLARGVAGRAPQLLVAETAAGDYAFLDVSKAAFDLTDRGVDGRSSPGPLDLFATTERGVYRPTETVYLTALLRDTHAKAVDDLPLTMEVERPDGVVASTELLSDQGAGSYFKAYTLDPEAMRGSWQVRLYADPKAAALTSVTFLVEDFEPERLAFDASAEKVPVAIGGVMPINVAAKYLYGASAPNLSVEADAILRVTTSVDGYAGYSFGREDDTFQTYYEPLGVVGTTDEAGNVTAEVTIPTPQATTKPLEAQINLSLVDTNGRTVQRSLTRAVLADVDRIGVKPAFDYGELDQGSAATFDVIAVAPTGETIDKAGLNWRLSRIETTYQWYRDNGTWRWEAITTTREIANGTVDTKASGPVQVGANVDWGRYLLEVDSTGEGATSTSYEFYAGYYYPEVGSNTPDTLQVALDKTSYRQGETANLKLDPQFAGTALILVVDDRIIDMKAVSVPAEGTTVALPVTADWGPGAYVTAMLYRPSDATEKRMPARALGLAFADVEPGDLKLDVKLGTPDVAKPRQSFDVKVNLGNVAAGETAYVAVAAVDLGILNLTRFQVPDPDGYFFGQRQLGVEIRDLYGNLIDPTQGTLGALRSGGDGEAARLGTPPPTSVLVALHSGIVTVGADGTATIKFDMPDFAGTVRVMAMAWTASQVGHSSADVIVRDPVVVTMSPPRFLRLDDTSRLLVEINNIEGPAGDFKVELITSEGLSTDAPEQTLTLKAGERTSLDLSLTGTAIGDNDLKLIITDPNGNALVKELTLGVRAASAPQTAARIVSLKPGETMTLDASYFADMIPHTGSLTLSVGPLARLDIPGLLLALDRYPYGCAEQVSSRAFPLLYLNEVAISIGMGTDAELKQRIEDAITNLLSKQNSAGGFGLWGPFSTSDLWLDSYVTDFLLRAKAEGFEVPDRAMQMALDNLGNQVSYASDFEKGGEDLAYALYDLARAGRAAIGDLRYYLEARLDRFGSPLAQAQLGAALALYGDRTRASEAFAAAMEGLRVKEDRYRWRIDYGSQLRDSAAVLALAAEFKPSGVDIPALTAQVAKLRDVTMYTSTQEDAWTLIAASQLIRDASDGSITIDGEELNGTVNEVYPQEYFDGASVTVANNGNTPTEAKVSVTAIPATPPKASGNGFTINRAYFLPDGTPVDDMSTASQNDRFVVVLTVKSTELGSGQYVIADPLPGGFEIENSDLTQGTGVGDVSWLTVYTPVHTEARTDQYIAAFRFTSLTEAVTTAYLVRAVSPGTFVLPGATVEDMYRPELRANTDAGQIEITSTGP